MLKYEDFHKYLTNVKNTWLEIDRLEEVLTVDWLCKISMLDDVLALLEDSMHDTDAWISYWCFEQNFGEDWDEHTASEADGTPIIMKTDRQLYDYLVKNYGA